MHSVKAERIVSCARDAALAAGGRGVRRYVFPLLLKAG